MTQLWPLMEAVYSGVGMLGRSPAIMLTSTPACSARVTDAPRAARVALTWTGCMAPCRLPHIAARMRWSALMRPEGGPREFVICADFRDALLCKNRE